MESSKERVLAIYPDAYVYCWGGWRDGESGHVIIRDRAEYEERLGAAETENLSRELVRILHSSRSGGGNLEDLLEVCLLKKP